MSQYAKAAILVRQNTDLVIDEIKLPDKLGVGQVIVKLDYSGICGSQIGEIKGVKGHDPYLPHLLGHEGSGSITAIGPGVTTVRIGDKVVLHWRKGNGIEAKPPKYGWGKKIINAGLVTTFNTHAVISENRVTTVPRDLDSKAAALFGCAITTGFGVIVNDAELKIGDNIVVLGAGGVGLNVIQGAKLAGANKIVAVDLFDNRLEISKKFGANVTINAKICKDLKSSIVAAMADLNIDIIVDNTGSPEMIKIAYELVKSNGKVILVGVPKKGAETSIYTLPLHFGKKLHGSEGGSTSPEVDIPKYSSLLQAGKLEYNALISSVRPLDDVNDAIRDMVSGKESGRILLKLD